MNIIISNKYEAMLSTLHIETIRTLNGEFTVEELSEEFKNFFFNKMIVDITAIKDYENIETIQKLSMAFDSSKIVLLLDDSMVVNSPLYLSQLVSMGIYNFTKNLNAIGFLINNPNSYKDVASYQLLNVSSEDIENLKKNPGQNTQVLEQRIIGVKNLTEHAGSTTFTYLLKIHLEKQYKVEAVELNHHDFELFEEGGLTSLASNELASFVDNHKDLEVIVVDISDAEPSTIYTDVLYLIEPGIIPLNKMIRQDEMILTKVKERKLILNKSVLNQRQVEDFERESHSRIFYNIPYVDDKDVDNKEITHLLATLGFTRFETKEKKNKGFSLFK